MKNEGLHRAVKALPKEEKHTLLRNANRIVTEAMNEKVCDVDIPPNGAQIPLGISMLQDSLVRVQNLVEDLGSCIVDVLREESEKDVCGLMDIDRPEGMSPIASHLCDLAQHSRLTERRLRILLDRVTL